MTAADHAGLDRQAVLATIGLGHARARLSFRVQFAVVWALLIVGLVYLLTAGRNPLNVEFMAEWAPFIVGGAGTTIVVSALAIAAAVVLALLGAVGRLSPIAAVNAVASFYVSLARGTPLLVQIFFAAFALAEVGLVLPVFVAGVGALAFNYGAYMTEIFRAGIEAVPRGQREAAASLGMPEPIIMRRIVLPQAFRIVVPAIGNEFIAMLKDSSLVSTIAVTELFWRAQTSGRSRNNIMEALLIAAVMYWVLTIVFSFFQERLERRLARSDH